MLGKGVYSKYIAVLWGFVKCLLFCSQMFFTFWWGVLRSVSKVVKNYGESYQQQHLEIPGGTLIKGRPGSSHCSPWCQKSEHGKLWCELCEGLWFTCVCAALLLFMSCMQAQLTIVKYSARQESTKAIATSASTWHTNPMPPRKFFQAYSQVKDWENPCHSLRVHSSFL